ncbi:hypothetical protein GCM10011506_23060 [Marivirga lumbricoides]|uniref:Uncharacterized protein n=3 Tax=Marivirga lumbricoides TaxID=1046115 RepID=A0ABQ1MAW2_9BACT|nr:hypothetical protein GCM10011506_23060 [Marivirga lumbricoides]
MIAGMDKNELVLLKFTSEEAKVLKWEHAKEFEYQNEMYDVVEQQTIGDTTYYWCWWDHEETALNKQLSLLVVKALNNIPERQEQEEWLSNYFKSLYLLNPSSWNFNSTGLTEHKSSVYFLINYFTYIPLPTPPPENR